ncbi:MAG: tetratricopeptide repeat protein [Deltaproteobacteria bacterium]|nr:tetratricopeptide repeat protein [Deltaproteobacteria bacterium]
MRCVRGWMACCLGIGIVLAAFPVMAKRPTAPTARAVEHNNRGAKFLSEGALEQAEFELKTAVELSPDYSEAYNNLGILYKQRNQLDTALEYFQKAVGLNADYASAWNHIAAVHIARGEYDLALKASGKAIKAEPTFADGVYNRALALFLKGRAMADLADRKKLYGEAEREFSKATQLNPKLTIAHKNLGDLYTELGQYEQAVIRYRLATEDHPADVAAWKQLANAYRLLGDAAKARNAELQAGIAEKSNKAGAEYAAGQKAVRAAEEKYAAGDRRGAGALYNQAIKAFAGALLADPRNADAAYQLGVAYLRQDVNEMARKAWLQTLAIAPDHAPALYNLGTLEAKMGLSAEARGHFCRFLSVGARQFPAEAQVVRRHMQEQGWQCRD